MHDPSRTCSLSFPTRTLSLRKETKLGWLDLEKVSFVSVGHFGLRKFESTIVAELCFLEDLWL